jgi:ataxia telangiectasia mutated family protein
LNSPELVPFRLTQNVIDGMGALGTAGTFTKAAETTLSVLKQNANGLLTILSAIVSDPLYKWSVSSTKACHHEHRQSADEPVEELDDLADKNSVAAHAIARDENRNELAAHAIARIHEKLLGYEDGTSGEQQSVESQVQLLVNAARDPENLCDMFPGWAPWM